MFIGSLDWLLLFLHVLRQRHVCLSSLTTPFMRKHLLVLVLANGLWLPIIRYRNECCMVRLDACFQEVIRHLRLFMSEAQFIFKVHDLALQGFQF